MIHLVLGMTVSYRGREYTLARFAEGEEREGGALRVECLRNRVDQLARSAHAEEAEAWRVMATMKAVADSALKG